MKRYISPQKQSGFTIVEIIVTLVVFSIGVIIVTLLITSIQFAQRNATYFSIATHAAKSKVEQIRSSGFDTVTDGDTFTSELPSTLPSGKTGVVHVSIPVDAPKSKKIEVTVTYPMGSTSKSVAITAYVDPPAVD